MKKCCFLFIIGAVFLSPCFSQNMVMLSGEYNLFKPPLWGAGIGYNMRLWDTYVYNDLLAYFGLIQAREPYILESFITEKVTDDEGNEVDETQSIFTEYEDFPHQFFFSIRDNLYFALDWKWVGLRAGIFASLGVYHFSDFPRLHLFVIPGGFAGISILPKSLISVTLDISPGYIFAFGFGEDGAALYDTGLYLSVALGVRLNLDKW